MRIRITQIEDKMEEVITEALMEMYNYGAHFHAYTDGEKMTLRKKLKEQKGRLVKFLKEWRKK